MTQSKSIFRKVRIFLATLFGLCITLLFLDTSGALHTWLGWAAKIQFIPALLALNFVVIALLVVLTLLFGRLYCSILCPLGLLQDLFAALGKRSKKHRYTYSPAKNVLRYSLLGIFVLSLIIGIASLTALLDPYAAFGRIAQNLFAPLYQWVNNLLAYIAERFDSYAFYSVEVWIRSWITFGIAVATFVLLGVLAWRNGRTYCNTVCPVGTVLGFLARFSLFKPVIDTQKCNSCGLCERNCKAACMNTQNHQIDYSRCVGCMDCIAICHKGAIQYKRRTRRKGHPADETAATTATTTAGASRRRFLATTATLTTAAVLKAQSDKVDGGLAVILDKEKPDRMTPIVPPGAQSLRHLSQHCTGCQLCVAACPNGVLRPSSRLENLMQPESSYERGYCRPECTRCSEVCPTGAIRHIDKAEKSAIQIGHAVWVKANCLPLTEGVRCGNCARHCPTGAIKMVPSDPANPKSAYIPSINTERCIGCGACENLCPARPFSAIYVEGNDCHRLV